LLKSIPEISHGCELHQYLPLQLYEAKRKPFLLTQKRGQSLQDYHKGFQAQLDIIQSLSGSFDGKDLISWAYRKDYIDPYTATENNKDRLLRHPVRHLKQLHSYPAQIKTNMDKCLMTLRMTKRRT
jgi:hypothetical protein